MCIYVIITLGNTIELLCEKKSSSVRFEKKIGNVFHELQLDFEFVRSHFNEDDNFIESHGIAVVLDMVCLMNLSLKKLTITLSSI